MIRVTLTTRVQRAITSCAGWLSASSVRTSSACLRASVQLFSDRRFLGGGQVLSDQLAAAFLLQLAGAGLVESCRRRSRPRR